MMNKKDWKKAEAEFDIIYDLDDAKRENYFEQLQQEKPDLYEQVKELWSYAQQSDSLLTGGINDFKTFVGEMAKEDGQANAPTMDGKTVGKYKIVKQLGYGGMGTVYLAERSDGSFDQQVALKFIRDGMNHELLVARFKQEKQIQAKLAHPSIPALYDADVDEHGTPYIVMEYVKGKPISEFIAEENPNLREKISLFTKVCQVIHFAHQNLVIHRDLKPSNILITEEGMCKLLDFGISKLLDEDTESNLTKTNARLFSVKYAAPEQLQGNPVTTATDIYSLGVILHELLCGFPPYETDTKSLSELERSICEKPITKPSTSIVQNKEHPAPAEEKIRISKQLKGDLDNIILKALEKEPQRRYASVKEFSEDLERFLEHKPVLARPAGFLYTSGKFIQRNKLAVASVFAVFVMLLGGFIYHSVTVTAERNTAQLEAEKFEKMSGFLIELFEYDDLAIPPEEATVANLLDAGVNRINQDLGDNPEVQAEIMLAIGNSYLQLGNIASGYEMTTKAVDIYEQLPEENTLSKSQVYLNLANAKYENGQPDAMESIDKAIEVAKEEHGDVSAEHAEALWLKGKVVYRAEGGESPEAEEIMDRYLEITEQVFSDDAPEYGLAVAEHAAYRVDLEKRLEALKNAAEVNINIHGQNHPTVANIFNTLGFYYRSSDVEQGIQYFNQSIDIYAELYGDAHFRTINTLTNLGDTYRIAGQMERSIETFQRAVNAAKSVYPDGSIRIADPQYWLSNAQIEAEMLTEAEQNLTEVLAVYEQNYEPGALKVEMARSNLGYAIRLQGREAEGTALINQTLKNVREVHGEDHRMIDFAESRL